MKGEDFMLENGQTAVKVSHTRRGAEIKGDLLAINVNLRLLYLFM